MVSPESDGVSLSAVFFVTDDFQARVSRLERLGAFERPVEKSVHDDDDFERLAKRKEFRVYDPDGVLDKPFSFVTWHDDGQRDLTVAVDDAFITAFTIIARGIDLRMIRLHVRST
jgi:hypothetical protein